MKLLSGWDKWKASLWAWELLTWFSPCIIFRKEATKLFLHWDTFMAADTSARAGDGVGRVEGRTRGQENADLQLLISFLSPAMTPTFHHSCHL